MKVQPWAGLVLNFRLENPKAFCEINWNAGQQQFCKLKTKVGWGLACKK